MNSKGKFLSDVGFSTLTWGLGLLAGFVVSPILARTLGEYEFGLWSLTQRVYTVALPLALLGLSSSVVRYTAMVRASDPDRSRRIATLTMTLTALSAALVVGVLLALNPWIARRVFADENLIPLVAIVAVAIWLDAQVQALSSTLRGFGLIKDQSSLALLARVLNLAGATGLALLVAPKAQMALWGLVAASVLMFIFQLGWGLRRQTLTPRLKWDGQIVKDLLVYGIPRIPGGFLLNMILAADSFFVGAMMGVTDAGHYGVATTLFGIAAGVVGPIGFVAFPLFSSLIGQQAGRQIARYLTSLTSFALFAGSFIAAVVAVLARPIVLVLYSEAFAAAITPLAIIMIGAVFYTLYVALRGYVGAYTVKPVLVYFLAVSVAVNLALNAALIPAYGVAGAAAATAAAYVVLGSLTLAYTWRVHPLRWRALQVERLPLALLPPVLVAFLVRPHLTNMLFLVLGGGLTALVFAGLLWILKVTWFTESSELVLARAARLAPRRRDEED